LAGKLRMACELLIPARGGEDDESVASFVRRRLGGEALAKIAQPMIGGIYTADSEKLSLLATFPTFREMERVFGGVSRGLAGENLEADAVCLAVPSFQAAALLKNFCPDAARELGAIAYESVATVNFIYRSHQIGHRLDGFGFVMPDIERRKIMACTFASVKFS